MPRTVYMLRLRSSDSDPWGDPEEFLTRKERDKAASFNRVMGGIRTHSYEERRAAEATPQEIGNYLDDFKAGIDAGPFGTPEFREAVERNQRQRMFKEEDHAIVVVHPREGEA